MSQSYVKECIFCHKKIRMSDQTSKWLPYNEDGSVHECKAKNGNNDISIQVLLKRLECIGITIDLQKLRNAK